MGTNAFERRIAAVRRFNRFYTQRIGVLQEGLVDSPFSLTESRVLYELAHRERPTASELGKDLGLDAGYLSRILRDFKRRGLVGKQVSRADARQSLLSLTARGQKEFAPLNARTREQVGAMLGRLAAADCERLVNSMRKIEALLGAKAERRASFILRPHQAGDMGWVVSRHGAIYAQEYGWNEEFEALVAEIVAAFIRNFDRTRERCWIAARDGQNVGSVFLVKESARVAKLRLLIVEPEARGLGIGKRLTDECVRFARRVGFKKITLWTQSILTAARHIYEQAGFRLVKEEPHVSFGHKLIGEYWELKL